MAGFKPLVSIIVLTYNSQRHIRPCLTALFKTEYEDFEVIVVDNASTDETIEIVKKEFPKVRLFLNKTNLGYAAGNNLAVKKARGSLVAFINPDTTVSPGWLGFLVSAIESAKIAACQPKILLSQKKNLLNGTGKTTNFLGFDWLTDYQKKDKQMKIREITSFSGSAVLIKKEVFLSFSGFDEDFFMYGEDSDLSWRMRLLGFKILFTPESVVYHEYKYKPEEHIQKASKKFYLLEKNRIVTLLKNYSLKTLILLLPVFFFMEVGMHIYFFSRRWWLGKIKGYFWILANRKKIMAKRKIVQDSRKLSDKEITESFIWTIDFKEFANPLLSNIANPALFLYGKIAQKLI